MTRCVRKGDVVSRLGGDEFTVILPGVTSIQDAAKVAQKIIETLDKPFKLESHELFITTSIGISMYPIDGSDMETLVKNADAAMYLAKEYGRNKYKFYTVAMNEAALEKLNLENNLRKAIQRQEMAVHYQPVFDLKTKEIKGVEALVRWQHPDLGLIEPDKFYVLAEETGLILQLGEWVLREACAQNKAWQQAGLPPEAQLAFLRDVWCNEVQGVLFCSPLPARELEEILAKHKIILPSGTLAEGKVAYH